MSEAVDPVFANIGDHNTALAMSEFFAVPEKFKVRSADLDPAHSAEFPPEPAYLTGLQIAHLTALEVDAPIAQKLWFNPQASSAFRAGEEFTEGYDEMVGAIHRSLPGEPAVAVQGRGADPYLRMVLEKTCAAGIRTVAAFALFQSVDDRRFYTGLAIPLKVFDETPLAFRHEMGSAATGLLKRGYEDDILPEDLKDAQKAIMRNDPSAKDMGFLLAASFLPEVKTVRNGISRAMLQLQTNGVGLNREQRRQQRRQR